MTQQQAQCIIQRVQEEVPQIKASFDASKTGKGDIGYRVRLELHDRVLYANHADEWESIKHAWQYSYLPEEQWVTPEDEEHMLYIVDGMPMAICQDKLGYWRATCYQNGQKYRKYWGKSDPRNQYQAITISEAREIREAAQWIAG